MKGIQYGKYAAIAALLVFAGSALVPSVFAAPISPKLNWSPNPVTTPGTATTATVTVSVDADCPTGAFFSGTITVTTPSAGVATYSVGSTPCGTNVNAVYPTQFTGTASTTACGTYTAEWKGVTTIASFDTLNAVSVTGCKVTGAPEFSGPAMLVAAVGLVLVAAIRKKNLVKF